MACNYYQIINYNSVENVPNQKEARTYSDLVREMKDAFVDILNKKIENN